MGDVFSVAKRSHVMSRIRGRGNKSTEHKMIEIFRSAGITGWRRGSRLLGKPDFVFSKEQIAVFVDGCFWHCCRRPGHSNLPVNNAEIWAEKLRKNVIRDKVVTRRLRKDGWIVVRFWEHDLRESNACVRRMKKVLGYRKIR
jgi:DNA mismatch endonuclease (patch repair protein)